MPETNALGVLIGRRMELRPVEDPPRQEGSQAAVLWDTPASAQAISMTAYCDIWLETTDFRLLDLSDREVVAEYNSSEALIRLRGQLQIPAKYPDLLVCLLTPTGKPEMIQRREWLRIKTAVPVRIKYKDAQDRQEKEVSTVTIDLSGGGVCLRRELGVSPGSMLSLTLELPTGAVEVRGEALQVGDKFTRVRFQSPPELVREKIQRHIFDVQLAIRRQGSD